MIQLLIFLFACNSPSENNLETVEPQVVAPQATTVATPYSQARINEQEQINNPVEELPLKPEPIINRVSYWAEFKDNTRGSGRATDADTFHQRVTTVGKRPTQAETGNAVSATWKTIYNTRDTGHYIRGAVAGVDDRIKAGSLDQADVLRVANMSEQEANQEGYTSLTWLMYNAYVNGGGAEGTKPYLLRRTLKGSYWSDFKLQATGSYQTEWAQLYQDGITTIGRRSSDVETANAIASTFEPIYKTYDTPYVETGAIAGIQDRIDAGSLNKEKVIQVSDMTSEEVARLGYSYLYWVMTHMWSVHTRSGKEEYSPYSSQIADVTVKFKGVDRGEVFVCTDIRELE